MFAEHKWKESVISIRVEIHAHGMGREEKKLIDISYDMVAAIVA